MTRNGRTGSTPVWGTKNEAATKVAAFFIWGWVQLYGNISTTFQILTLGSAKQFFINMPCKIYRAFTVAKVVCILNRLVTVLQIRIFTDINADISYKYGYLRR